VRSVAWLGTTFANQRSPGTFSSIGGEETFP
jgi:hypothetical protein